MKRCRWNGRGEYWLKKQQQGNCRMQTKIRAAILLLAADDGGESAGYRPQKVIMLFPFSNCAQHTRVGRTMRRAFGSQIRSSSQEGGGWVVLS